MLMERRNLEPRTQSLAAESQSGVAQLVEFVRRGRLLILAAAACGLVLGLVAYAVLPPKFESTAEVLVTKKDSNLPNQGVEGAVWYDGRMAEEILSTHIRIAGSRRIAMNAIERGRLDKLPVLKSKETEETSLVDYIVENLDITRGGEGAAKRAHVLNMTFKHSDADECAKVLGAIFESYREFLSATFDNAHGEAERLISKAGSELAKKLHEQESGYQQFRESAPLLWEGEETQNVHQLRLLRIGDALADARIKLARAESRLGVVQRPLAADRGGDSNLRGSDLQGGDTDLDLLATIDEADIERLTLIVDVETGDAMSEAFQAKQPERNESAAAEFQNLLALMLSERALLTELGEGHPEVAKVRDQIGYVQNFLQNARNGQPKEFDPATIAPGDIVSAYGSLLKNDIAALRQQVQELEKAAAVETASAKELVGYEVENETRLREMTRTQELYNTVVARVQDVGLVSDYSGFIIESLAPVELGEERSLGLAALALLGLVFGGVCGFGLAVVADMFDKTFHSSTEISQVLSAPVLAHIPDFRRNLDRRRAAPHAVASSLSDTRLAILHQMLGPAGESFRRLRTSLLIEARHRKCHVIACVAPHRAAGNSTVAANLGIALAQAQNKVLLIDANFHDAVLGEVFGVARQPGLCELLNHGADVPDAIHKTGIDKLWVVPAGGISHAAIDSQELSRLPNIIESIGAKFDFVLIDTAPILSASAAEEVATAADCTIVTLEIAKDGRPDAARALERLAMLDVDVLGLVVNRVGSWRSRNYTNKEIGLSAAAASRNGVYDGARLRKRSHGAFARESS